MNSIDPIEATTSKTFSCSAVLKSRFDASENSFVVLEHADEAIELIDSPFIALSRICGKYAFCLSNRIDLRYFPMPFFDLRTTPARRVARLTATRWCRDGRLRSRSPTALSSSPPSTSLEPLRYSGTQSTGFILSGIARRLAP